GTASRSGDAHRIGRGARQVDRAVSDREPGARRIRRYRGSGARPSGHAVSPDTGPRDHGRRTATLDWRVLTFSATTAVAGAVPFGLAPALRGSKLTVAGAYRDGGRGQAGAGSYRFQHSLIVVETALAVVLLTIGAVLLQTFQQLRQLDLGIRGERVLTFVTPL